MRPHASNFLVMPTFLHGPLSALQRMTREEGRRCAEQYRREGTLPEPRESREVAPGEVVLVHEVVDFQRERPAWRLYALGDVPAGLAEALDWQDAFRLYDVYEAHARDTAWGALYYATGRMAPDDAGCFARRFKAVLRFWEILESARYLFSSPRAPLTLEELMVEACGWATRAWNPEGAGSFRSRLETVAERMARATRDECTEVILRQVPRMLPLARHLRHPNVLANLDFWRARLAALSPEAFARVSAARPGELISCMTLWDEQLGMQ